MQQIIYWFWIFFRNHSSWWMFWICPKARTPSSLLSLLESNKRGQ